MSAKRVNPQLIDTVSGVIKAAMAQGNREAYSLAFVLDAAGLLQSPETAAELEAQAKQARTEATADVDDHLAEILARADAATPGPWCTDAWEIYQGAEYEPGISWWIGETCRGTSTPEQDRADASFVAAARTDVPELVAAVQLLTAEAAGLRAQVAELEAAAEAVRGQHYEVDGSPDEVGSCIQCGSDYPCATVQALDVQAPDPADEQMSNADIFTASELYEMDRDDEFMYDAEDYARDEGGAA